MFELFILPDCPYCKRVMNFLADKNIEFIPKDVSNDNNMQLLLELGKKEQVPFLYNTEEKNGLYESNDIIDYVSMWVKS